MLIDKIPIKFKNKLPINSFFIKGELNTPNLIKDLAYANSEFYNPQKMRCYGFYKPAFL